jgi:mannose-6-phosphate isomerase-like protein (cupin superfamily)
MFLKEVIVNLSTTAIQLRAGGVAEASPRADRTDFGLWTVLSVRADSDEQLHSDVWERHPAGDEVLCVVAGAVDVHLRRRDAERQDAVFEVQAGEAFLVLAGEWHRLTVREPVQLLAITSAIGTEHEQDAGAGRAA